MLDIRPDARVSPPSYDVAVGEKFNNLSSAAVYGPIVWPTKPFSLATEDFMSNAVAAGYEDYTSDDEYLEHWLRGNDKDIVKIKIIRTILR